MKTENEKKQDAKALMQTNFYKQKNEALQNELQKTKALFFNVQIPDFLNYKNEFPDRKQFIKTSEEKQKLKYLKSICTNKGKLNTIVKVW